MPEDLDKPACTHGGKPGFLTLTYLINTAEPHPAEKPPTSLSRQIRYKVGYWVKKVFFSCLLRLSLLSGTSVSQSNCSDLERFPIQLARLWRPILFLLMSRNQGRHGRRLSITACESSSWKRVNGEQFIQIEIKHFAIFRLTN